MRVYGRTYDAYGNPTWVEVQTDSNGYNDYVYITALVQCLKLNINESPFWADWGIPGYISLIQQVFPDYYMALMQQRFAQHFASLVISKVNVPDPTYNLSIITHQGISMTIPVQVPV